MISKIDMYKTFYIIIIISLTSSLSLSQNNHAGENRFAVGGRIGLSVAGGAETSAGFQFGITGEYFFNQDFEMAAISEVNINSQTGTPIEWANSFKYFISINKADIKPYIDGGFGLWFYPGGPSFAIRFGGGTNFLATPKIYIPVDIQIGPVFATGGSVFYFAVTSGIRYYLP